MKTFAVVLCLAIVWAHAGEVPKCTPADGSLWLADSLREMRAIRAGMTRQDLLKVFTPAAGFSAAGRFRRTYVYRDSPNIRVDVEFAAPEAEADASGPENPKDVIKSISRPYLAEAVYD